MPVTTLEPTILDAPDVVLGEDVDDDDGLTHFAKRADIMRSMVDGTPFVTLCGRKMLATKDETKYPTCKTCESLLYTLL